jgi:predicted nucleotidyltransferase
MHMSELAISPRDVEAIRDWAARSENVRRVWLFGSRVKGGARPDSDLDVAVEPIDCQDDWCEHQTRWRSELAGRTDSQLDLWEYKPGRDTRLDAAIADGSILVCETPPNTSLERTREG